MKGELALWTALISSLCWRFCPIEAVPDNISQPVVIDGCGPHCRKHCKWFFSGDTDLGEGFNINILIAYYLRMEGESRGQTLERYSQCYYTKLGTYTMSSFNPWGPMGRTLNLQRRWNWGPWRQPEGDLELESCVSKFKTPVFPSDCCFLFLVIFF